MAGRGGEGGARGSAGGLLVFLRKRESVSDAQAMMRAGTGQENAPSSLSGDTNSCNGCAPSGRYTLTGTLLTPFASGTRSFPLEGVGERVNAGEAK